MARKLRIQYEGAIYHVINRGNYRRDLFESAGAAQAGRANGVRPRIVSFWVAERGMPSLGG